MSAEFGTDSPIKVHERTKARVRLGGASLKITMGDFVGEAVDILYYLGNDILEANSQAIANGEEIPYPRDEFRAELEKRITLP